MFSVWVGGVEVNDYEMSLVEAETLAEQFIDDGNDDVYIVKNDD